MEIKQRDHHWGFDSLPVQLDPGATMPRRSHPTDAGLDLFAIVAPSAGSPDGELPAFLHRIYGGNFAKFSTGVHVAIPPGYVGKVEARSSLGGRGIAVLGGVIDAGYRGQIVVVLINVSRFSVTLDLRKAIAQLVIYPIALPRPVAVESLDATERGDGGFGSTDGRARNEVAG